MRSWDLLQLFQGIKMMNSLFSNFRDGRCLEIEPFPHGFVDLKFQDVS